MTAGKGKKKEAVAADVYSAFEQAIEAFHSSKFEKAKALFEKIDADFPDEVEVQARARSFVKICERRLEAEGDGGVAESAEQAFDMGVFHHNRGEFDEAVTFFDKALSLSSEDAHHVHYAKASTMVLQGDEEGALKLLKKAVEANESYRYHAQHDPDFVPISESDRFRALIGDRC